MVRIQCTVASLILCAFHLEQRIDEPDQVMLEPLDEWPGQRSRNSQHFKILTTNSSAEWCEIVRSRFHLRCSKRHFLMSNLSVRLLPNRPPKVHTRQIYPPTNFT